MEVWTGSPPVVALAVPVAGAADADSVAEPVAELAVVLLGAAADASVTLVLPQTKVCLQLSC